jgi:hypothetical protein
MKMNMVHWWNENGTENLSTWREICPSVILSTTDLTYNGLQSISIDKYSKTPI